MTGYFDWAATSPPDTEIHRLAFEKASEAWGNPSSLYSVGREAAASLEEARKKCAAVLDVPADTLFFTSGGTESDHLPLLSLLRRPVKGSLIVSAVEHPAILNQAKMLESCGWKVITVSPDENGIISPETVVSAVQEDTVFAAVMAVNNETGAIQPVKDIAAALSQNSRRRIHFHTDAVQAAGKIPLDLKNSGIDSAAFSGHKLGGARGAGLLYCAGKPESFISGGGQERGVRPGTENLYGAWSTALALEKAYSRMKNPETAEKSRKTAALLFRSLSSIPGIRPLPASRTESDERFSPFVFQFTNPLLPGEVLVRALSDRKVFISTGSACSVKKKTRPVLQAMKIPEKDILNAFRISTGYETTEEDIKLLCESLAEIIC